MCVIVFVHAWSGMSGFRAWSGGAMNHKEGQAQSESEIKNINCY